MSAGRTRSGSILAVAVSLAAALGGCGGDEDSGGGEEALRKVAAAPDKTSATGTARFFAQLRSHPTGEIDVSADGILDMRNVRARGRLTYRSYPGGPGELLFFSDYGGEFYRPSRAAKWTPGGGGTSFGGFNDVGSSVRYLVGVTGEAEPGDETIVRGARTTPYQATVDIEKVATEEVPASRSEGFKDQFEELEDSRLPVEVWLDGDGLVRRMRYDVPSGEVEDTLREDEKISLTFELFDFGKPKPIDPLPPERIGG